MNPTKKQKQAWRYLLDKITRLVCFGGGAGGGKSHLGCEWLLYMSLRYPGTRWFIARNELKQIRETTLQTFYKVLRYYEILPDSILKYNAQDHYIQFHNGSRILLLDVQYLPSDPFYERISGAEFTGGWCEEASEIDERAVDTLQSRVGRWMNDKYGIVAKILLTLNPKKTWIFYRIYLEWKKGTLDKTIAFVQSLVDDNPYNESGYKETLERLTDSVKRERLLYGNWEYSEQAGQLIPNEYINDALSGNASLVKGGDRFITADIARFGSDNTVIFLWSGFRAEQVYIYSHISTTESADKIKELQQQHSVSIRNVIVDEDGIGGGVVDTLGCVGFLNGSKALDVGNNAENFANLKTQAYYRLSEMFKEKMIYVNYNGNTEVKNKLIQELEQVRLKDSDTENKISILSKKEVKQRIGRSPDLADALMMRMYFELQPQGGTYFGGAIRVGKPYTTGGMSELERHREYIKQRQKTIRIM